MDLKDFDNETKFTEQQIDTLQKGVDDNLLTSDHDDSVGVPFQPPELISKSALSHTQHDMSTYGPKHGSTSSVPKRRFQQPLRAP